MGVALAQTVVLEDVRIVDAEGARTAEILVVEDGWITHIGEEGSQWEGLERRSVEGRTVVPGLVDAHVHLTLAPGAAFVERTPQQESERLAHHLRAFVATGVTTVLDAGITPQNAERLAQQAGPQPTIRLLGPMVSPPDGYVRSFVPEFEVTSDAETLQRQLEEFDRFDPIGVKVAMEDGLLRPIWPLPSDEVRQALNSQPRPLFVHALDHEMLVEALETLDVHALVHAPDRVDGLAERLQSIPVITTLTVFDAMRTPAHPERLETPLALRVVPDDERRAIQDRRLRRISNLAALEAFLPRMPGLLRADMVGLLTTDRRFAKQVEEVGAGLLELHRSGVTLVLGSDSGNWPVFLVYLHGLSTVLEAEALQAVGFTPLEVLTLGTRNGAELLGLGDEIGTVEVGKRASLVVLDADPLQDISALRAVAWVLHDGRMATPEEWMQVR